MKKIEAKIVADSINPQGDRITTYLLTFPRFILAELNTHRVFSKNSASSRAIPFEKMVEMVETDPFIPIAWQKDHKGMQGTEYFTNERVSNYSIDLDGNEITYQLEEEWLEAKNSAVEQAKNMNELGLTKQLCNRLLEPFMWHTVLLTGTEFENFFELRCPQYGNNEQGYFKSKKDALKHLQGRGVDITNLLKSTDIEWQKINKGQAEIHMMALAEAMYDAYNESTPKELESGEWHIPFGDNFDKDKVAELYYEVINNDRPNSHISSIEETKIKISTARCARLSYMTFDGEIDYEKDLKLHDTLLESQHMSPFEHCARAMSNEEYETHYKGILSKGLEYYHPQEEGMGWLNNFKGFIQYRYLVENL